MSRPAPGALPADAEESRYRLAYDEAQRALGTQQGDLSALQARAATLLSAGAIATTFLGGLRGLGLFRTVVARSEPGAVVSLGSPVWILALLLGAFGVLVALCLAVLWPTGEWVFQLDPRGLIRVLDTDAVKQATTAALYRDLALRMHHHAERNEKRLGQRVNALRAAIATLAVDVVLLVVVVARG